MTDRFRISLDAPISLLEGYFSLPALEAARVLNPYEDRKEVSSSVQNCAAFKIDIPRSMETKDGSKRIIEIKLTGNFQVATAIDDFQSIKLDKGLCQLLTIEWSTQSPTFDAEIAALRCFTDPPSEGEGPSHKARCAFELIQNFHGIKEYYSLHTDFPHLKDPVMQAIPPLIRDKFSKFNRDQRAAFDGLAKMPYGLHFVNGCPGAGKTEWNMVVSGLIHSGKRAESKRRFSPILFLVDINETVTQAADRYQSLCQAANLSVNVVRMYGWPHEVRNSDKVKSAEETQASRFTREFLTAAGLARQTTLKRDKKKAPTLDEAAWEYFDRYQGKALLPLKELLEKMESGQALSNKD
ncbi:hypothetical protein ESCO_003260 [Escovopsis weberi]|uniref:DNA2/NAM7 helicase helicase domain-containing protein n=1 Tax=Escovopsis weberi TaxID=150374 RepID=A0A0M8N064_ESCWE|nr:hypothetical protein ESCO_003260 [Escovopsis weberi]